jgi:hypothetical protein
MYPGSMIDWSSLGGLGSLGLGERTPKPPPEPAPVEYPGPIEPLPEQPFEWQFGDFVLLGSLLVVAILALGVLL